MRFRYFRIFFSDFVLLPAIIFCLLNVSLMTYALRMLKGQLTIVVNAREFSEVYADPEVNDSIKAKLRLIDEIKQFAYDSIGLKHSDNYTTFYDQKGQRLMYVVTAAERYELKAHLWHFPVLGDVPYKGFFNEAKAKEEYDRLKSLGLDADIGGASGWSTLGWFRDPVLSSMLNRSEGELAELIIHELTHGTIFVSDSVDYNENLAEFVGVRGAYLYLRAKYGEDSREYIEYWTDQREDEYKSTFMLEQARLLDSVYKSFTPTMSIEEKEQQRRNNFLFIWGRAQILDLKSDSTFADRIHKKLEASGNTLFLQYTRYEAKQDDFQDQFVSCDYNLATFVKSMVVKYGS